MEIVNNNISPLPFYDSLAQQNHHKDYAFGQIYPLVVPMCFIIPFQVIIINSTTTQISQVKLWSYNTNTYTDITDDIIAAGLELKDFSTFQILRYNATQALNALANIGFYYLEIIFADGNHIYSEIFDIVDNISDYMNLAYTNSYNFSLKGGIIDFSDNFEFRCYLNSQVGKPKYEFEEEVTERMGYSFVASQMSKKVYNFTFLAPEYLCDALRIVRMCDSKSIISKALYYDLTSFNMDTEWQEQGDLAVVECKFETDTVIANIVGYNTGTISGSFNEDFNEDFDK